MLLVRTIKLMICFISPPFLLRDTEFIRNRSCRCVCTVQYALFPSFALLRDRNYQGQVSQVGVIDVHMQHVLLPTFPSPRFKIFAGNRSCRWVYIVHFHRSADVAAFLPTFSLINIEFIRNRSCQLIEIHFRCVLTVQYHMLYLRLLSFKRENLLSTSLV